MSAHQDGHGVTTSMNLTNDADGGDSGEDAEDYAVAKLSINGPTMKHPMNLPMKAER